MRLLLVMDMQEITVGDQHAAMFSYDEQLLSRVNDRIMEYEPENVVYIRNLMKRTFMNKLAPVQVYEGTKEAELAEKLKVVSDHIFDKYKGNAFTNQEVVDFVKAKSPEEIEIVGVDGGGCVALTAIGAAEKGYRVSINESCVGTIMEKQKSKLHGKMEQLGVRRTDLCGTA